MIDSALPTLLQSLSEFLQDMLETGSEHLLELFCTLLPLCSLLVLLNYLLLKRHPIFDVFQLLL